MIRAASVSVLVKGIAAIFFAAIPVWADTNLPPVVPELPEVSYSVVRLFGALALVLGLFLGGVWCYRNWQRLTIHRGRSPRLNVLEVRSLGGRHALYLVGCDEHRFLLSASPTGVRLLSELPDGERDASATTGSKAPSFASSLERAGAPPP